MKLVPKKTARLTVSGNNMAAKKVMVMVKPVTIFCVFIFVCLLYGLRSVYLSGFSKHENWHK